MKVYSNVLVERDLYEALPDGVSIAVYQRIGNPRKRRQGWNISLSGSSRYTSQALGSVHKAATWEEHGVWMDALFAKDPNAIIATYNGQADFYRQTAEASERNRRYEEITGRERPGYEAPWL